MKTGFLKTTTKTTVWRGLEQRLQTLSVSQLEDLAEALLDFSDVNDLSRWLDNQ